MSERCDPGRARRKTRHNDFEIIISSVGAHVGSLASFIDCKFDPDLIRRAARQQTLMQPNSTRLDVGIGSERKRSADWVCCSKDDT